jgi:Domain of unknown function (DUF4844)
VKQTLSLIVGLTLILFTACGQGELKTTENTMPKFEEFKNKEKFIKDDKVFYSGISDLGLKPDLTQKINLAADDFKKLANKGNVSEKEYQNAIKIGLNRFANLYLQLDTEDRERICYYFEELMDIVGLESSGGHLNFFMYGFDPTKK